MMVYHLLLLMMYVPVLFSNTKFYMHVCTSMFVHIVNTICAEYICPLLSPSYTWYMCLLEIVYSVTEFCLSECEDAPH